ncbi:hypothetical protein RCL1_003286 [Eukaryota sp. TZLM3-RCL]
MRNQILPALKYLASQGLYRKSLNVSNVLVCSLRPICIKLSLFSDTDVLIGSLNTEIPVQEFWKEKMNQQEEVCFDELIRSIVKSVFPYSIMDKNIVFTNPNTLERNDLESLKALICSIESETMFKSGHFIDDFSSVNNNLSCDFKSFNSQEQKNLFFSKTVLFHVFTQGIMKFKRPLLVFVIDNSLFNSRNKNKDFSNFATKLVSISFDFRSLFFHAFNSACASRAHCLVIRNSKGYQDSIIFSRCINTSKFSSPSVVCSNWLNKFPITSIITKTLNFGTEIIDTEKVTNLEVVSFSEDLDAVTLFSNLSSFSLADSSHVDFNALASCHNLSSISLELCIISDLSPFSLLEQLTDLSLIKVFVTDFSPLPTFKRLTKLLLCECNITDLSLLSPLQQLQDLDLSDLEITDISILSSLEDLRALSLSINGNTNLSPLSCLKYLEKLDLHNHRLTDLPASSLFKLEKLSLKGTKVYDLWALKHLINLSTLDVRNTLLPKKHQRKLTSSSEIKTLINSCESGVFARVLTSCFPGDLSLYSHCSRLKSLNLSAQWVRNISEISKFTHIETLDLTNVTFRNDKITDISFLSFCFKLKSLVLDGSKVTVLSPLSYLSNSLISLSLNETLVSDLRQLSSLKQLEFLSLNYNNITDISPLSSLRNLTTLYLRKTKISNLRPLRNLTKLYSLDVRETLLPEEQQEEVSGFGCVQEFLSNNAVVPVSSNNHLRKRTFTPVLSSKKVKRVRARVNK